MFDPPYRPKLCGLVPYEPTGLMQAEILRCALDIIDEYRQLDLLPLTVRQVYYRLVATHDAFPKTKEFAETVGNVLARGRRDDGLIPWDAIRDDTAITNEADGYESPDEFQRTLAAVAANYKRDRQQGQLAHIIVVCEAAGMVPMLARACHPYGVAVCSSGGMTSLTAKYELATIIAEQPTILLHIGDLDPAGVSLFANLYHDVAKFVFDLSPAYSEAQMSDGWYLCAHIAVTENQVNEYGLLTGTTKKRKPPAAPYSRWWTGINGDLKLVCEAEALPPEILIAIVKSEIEARIDMRVRSDVLRQEKTERARISTRVAKQLRLGRHGRESAVTPAIAGEIRDRRRHGQSIRKIADYVGIPKSSVGRFLLED